MAPAELHDVPDDEEVAGEAQLLDHGQLVVDLGVRPGVRGLGTGPIAGQGPVLGQSTKPGHLGEPRGRRERRQPRGDQVEVEGALGGQGGGPFHHPGITGEAAGLLGPTAEVGGGRRRQPALQVVEAAAGPDRGHRGGQLAPRRVVVVDVIGGDQVGARCDGDGGQGVVAGRVERVAVVPELDGNVVPAEEALEVGEGGAGGGGAVLEEGVGHDPLAAPGQDQPVIRAGKRGRVGLDPLCAENGGLGAGPDGGQGLQVDLGLALLPPRHLRRGDGPGQAAVADGVAGEDDEVVAFGVGHPVLPAGEAEAQLGAEDGGQADGRRRLGEAHHAIHAVVIGEGEGGEAEAGCFLGQFFRVRCAVEEAEVGMAVQLGVGDRGHRAPLAGQVVGRLVGLAVVGPGRAVTTVAVSRKRPGPAGQPGLQLLPGHRWVLPPHDATLVR